MTILAFAPPDARPRVSRGGLAEEIPLMVPGPDGFAAAAGGVVRGERALFAVVLRARQRLRLAVEDDEGNAAFELYEPRARVAFGPWGTEIEGAALTPDGGVDCWAGEIARAGLHVIAVGTTRGNASFRLRLCAT